MKSRSTLALSLVTLFSSIAFLVGAVAPSAQAVVYSCAQGGACAVGDLGPGGGRVFYSPGTTFTMTGAPCATACRYLESAPTSGAYAFDNVTTHQLLGGVDHLLASESETIGSGYSNTSLLVSISSTSTNAANVAKAYRGSGNLSDWFLPSYLEIMAYWNSGPTDSTSFYMSSNRLGGSITIVSSGGPYYDYNTGKRPVIPIRAFTRGAAPVISLSQSSLSAMAGSSVTSYSISSTGGTVGDYSISPNIAITPVNGITFSTSTGLISGTPTSSATAASYTITATNGGGTSTATFTITVALPAQTITFTQPPNLVLGGTPAVLVASASPSGYTVAFASTTTGVCSVSGTTLTILTAGTCSITASQNGNPSYSAATNVIKSFSIYSGSISGTATFGQVLTANATAFTPVSYQWKRSATVGGTYTNIAGATSSTYTLTGSDVGNYVKVSMTSSDALVVTTSASASVGALSQTITFGALSGVKLTASPVTLSGASLATASSGLIPTYSSSTIETCTATSAGVITLKLVGTCTIVASQAGSSGYGAATPVSQNLIISADVPAAPFINSVSTGGGAGATSGTASVKFTPGASNGATIDSFTVTATNGGTTLTQMVLSGTGDSATVTGLTLGTAYTIAVKAFNSAGGSTARTYGSTVTPASAPYAVTNLRTTQSAAGSLRVNFTPPSSLGGGTFTRYEYFIRPSGGTFPLSASDSSTVGSGGGTAPADPAYTFTGLTPTSAYDIKVVVVTSANGGTLDASTAIVSQVPAAVPTAPLLTLTQTDSQTVLVEWFAQSDNGSALVAPYFTKTVTVDGSAATCTGSSSTISGGSCSVTGLVGGQVVSASVYATNIIGNSSTTTGNSSGVIGTVSAPTSLVATAGNAQISIAFNQVTNGDSVIYYRYSTNGVDYLVNSATTSPVIVAGLTNGTSYTIYLQAVGATNGAGPVSASVVATPIAPATGPAPVVLGPPPSTFVVVANPKISRSGASLVCSSGTYKFKKQGGKEESSSIASQLISLLSNGSVVDSEKTLGAQATFDLKSSYKGTTMSCEVGIQQEEVVKTYSSLDKEVISAFESAMTSAIYGSNTTYYSERDMAYMKRDAGDTKLWKEMLDKALAKREDTKVQAGLDYLANLEKAGISILVDRDKVAPGPMPTPTPAPTKSPEVSVTGNVQPVAMKLVGNIYFASGTYFLNDEAKKTIKALASLIFMKSPSTVLSYGFTDSKGGADNTLLSQNRAKAVAQLLRSLLPGQKIATGWYASSKPVATGNSKAALAKNRRVEIYIK
jgi:outer membrane protein OmpA-like peptidoglycan-associated protein